MGDPKFPAPDQSKEGRTILSEGELLVIPELKRGRTLRIRKLAIQDAEGSGVPVGDAAEGKLGSDIRIGSPIRLDSGLSSTMVSEVSRRGDRYLARTLTSVFEIEPIGPPGELQGVELKSQYGEVHLPVDAKVAELGNEIVSIPFSSGEQNLSFYINKQNLNSLLLEVNGGQLFRAMQGRFIVVAKVGRGHLPFFISSGMTAEGTGGGKRQGEWYPFFGYCGGWIIKGHTEANGDMLYSSTINQVQAVLNANLRFPSDYISPTGKFGIYEEGKYEPTEVLADLSQHIKYQNVMYTPFADRRTEEYIARITGYNPQRVNRTDDSSRKWMRDIVVAIGADR